MQHEPDDADTYTTCWAAPSACTMEGMREAAGAYASRMGGRYNVYDRNCFTFACEMVATCAVDEARGSDVFNCSRALMYGERAAVDDGAGYGP